MKKAYLAGDGLKKGNQILRGMERDAINALKTVHLFNPWDQKDINDKTKNPTAEMIHEKDFNAMLDAEIIIADVDNNSVGTSVEMGEMNGVNYMLKRLHDIMIVANYAKSEEQFNEVVALQVKRLLREIPIKDVYWHTSDVRDGATELEGQWRRSHSYNQYLIGTMLMLSGEPMKFEEILERLSVLNN
ncbi:nucleoside 2-deoxyribosyltransferase [Peribacillus frigoritolerans]|uniref:Nucleoside 2-deoxyribosyltransferase n=1 Tax=Peribacillus castrilensis TaxID=2897690 RepID=A0AAW9NPS4_9BACI|nr:nucleoside 2-deoxyribosyltransferase [Peribacillus castrilensis]